MPFSIIRCTRFAALLVAFGSLARAQDVKISGADLDLEQHKITVRLSPMDPDAFLKAVPNLLEMANWHINLQTSGSGSRKEIAAKPGVTGAATQTVELSVSPGSFGNVASRTDIPKNWLSVGFQGQTVTVPTGPAPPQKARWPYGDCFNMALTSDKKNANVNITGGLQAGVGAKPQYDWSVAATCSLHGYAGRGAGSFGPSFSGEASQENNADPDSLKAGLTWIRTIAPENTRNGWKFTADLLSYEFERKTKKEPVIRDGKAVDQPFLEKNTNLMWTGKAAYVSGWAPLNWTLTFAGFEAGKSLSRSVRKDSQSSDEQPVARMFFSLDVYRILVHREKAKITLHGQQILRLPFEPEPYQQADVDGGKMFLTDKPRHYSLVEVGLPVMDGVGINLQYKRGSLPPSFAFVDHQITIGFNLLLKQK